MLHNPLVLLWVCFFCVTIFFGGMFEDSSGIEVTPVGSILRKQNKQEKRKKKKKQRARLVF